MAVILGILIGIVAGVASGLAGVGGGVILVPALVYLLDVPQAVAQGTSTIAILFTSVAGTVVNVRHRYVDIRGAVIVGLGGVLTGFAGARLAALLDPDVLSRLFGLLVLVTGVRTGVQGWRERRRTAISGG